MALDADQDDRLLDDADPADDLSDGDIEDESCDDIDSAEVHDATMGYSNAQLRTTVSHSSTTTPATVAARRVWGRRKWYPKGVTNWRDAADCRAALEYDCPCGDKCLARLNNDVIEVYEHRRRLRTQAKALRSGGLRDVLRAELARHYESSTGRFSKSFLWLDPLVISV